MSINLQPIYTAELNRIHAELNALARSLAHSTIQADEHLSCTEHITACRNATTELEKSLTLLHDHYRAACEDRDTTHAELRSAFIRLSVLTGASSPEPEKKPTTCMARLIGFLIFTGILFAGALIGAAIAHHLLTH